MFKTKLTVEFEVETQFGPDDAVKMIDTLTRVPAIKSVSLVGIESDWKLQPHMVPSVNLNYRAICNVPSKVR